MRGSVREHTSTIVVSALASMFAATLILFTGIFTASLDPALVENSPTFRTMLLTVSSVFILIALYVGAIVTANTFATIIAGRTRTIALLRLVGATSATVRNKVATEGLLVGLVGATIGFVIATALAAAAVAIGPGAGWLPEDREYPLFDPLAVGAVAVVVFTTWVAAWSGSRRVAGVSPIAATGAAIELRPEASRSRTARTVWSILLLAGGAVTITFGILMSFVTPAALLVSFFGGVLSFTGIAVGAHFIMPPLLKLSGRLLGGSPTSRLAAANAVRFPERSARATIGLVIGITLVVMFAVAMESFRNMVYVAYTADPASKAAADEGLRMISAVFTGLVGFSAVIAAVGMINTLSLSVLQRTRELGLLRSLGFTGAQVRRMVIAESAQMTFAALGFGLALGIFYGWVAAQSLMGSDAGIVAPAIPWPMLIAVAVGGVLLAVGAAAAPAQRAIRLSPVAALAVD